MDALISELKELIVHTLSLSDVPPSTIDENAPLFGEGLGLDSIDALELAVAVSKKYSVSLKADEEDTQRAFSSVTALAARILEEKGATHSA